jgi:hypothetical protein
MFMRKAILVLGLVGLASCSSVKTGDQQTDELLVHMSKGTQVMGKDFDEKFTKDGFINGEFIAIGTANSADLDYMIRPLRVRAEADATARLLKSAPSEFKKIVVGAIDSANGDEGSVQESQIQITEVKALTGMKSSFDDIQCVKTASPNQNLKYNYNKECRVIVRVPASNLSKAYSYTLDKKYSIQQQNEIQKLLMEEISKPSALDKSVTPVQAKVNQ